MSGVAEQRFAVPECADDDIAAADLGHAAAGQLERVVGTLAVQDSDGHAARLPRTEYRR